VSVPPWLRNVCAPEPARTHELHFSPVSCS
jgi:hypothetical protein